MTKMENPNFNKEILGFSKNAVKMSFDALGAFSGQAAVLADNLLGSVPNVPEEGKKAVSTYFKESQKVLASLKKYVDSGLELNWTAKDAPLKNLEAMETFYNDTFGQAIEIKKEANALVEKGTKQLPKEAKSVVDFWAESVNGGFELFQSCVNKDFELAKKALSGVFFSAPTAKPKADTKL
jgi:hypothetical protein